MPPLDDTDRTEIGTLITTALGLAEGKNLVDTLGSAVNDGINKYDARVTRESKSAQEALDATLKGITDGLEALKTKPPVDPEDPIPGLTDDQLKKLDGPTRALIANLNLKQKELAESFERSEAERKKQDEVAKATAATQATASLRNAVRDALLDKDSVGADYDPADLDMFVGSLVDGVRRTEAGDYEFRVGVDEITKDPVYKTLADGLKGISGSATAKRFQRAVGGTPPGTPPGGPPGGPDGKIGAAALATMKPSEIAKAQSEGKIDLTAP